MSAFNHRGMCSKQRVAVVLVRSPGVRGVCFVPVSAGRLSRGAVRMTILPRGWSTWVHFRFQDAGTVGSSRITFLWGQRSCLTAIQRQTDAS